MTTPDPCPDLLVVGGGTMGFALLSAAIRSHAIDPSRIVVIEPDAARHPSLVALGVRVRSSIQDLTEAPSTFAPAPASYRVLLAVKPQVYPLVVPVLRALPRPAAVVSIMAGVRSDRIADDMLPGSPHLVIRAMPNTPARISRGITALAIRSDTPDPHREFAVLFFAAAGQTVRIDESQLDAFTALAGSGPAYVFFLAEAMIVAAIAQGFPPEQADRIVRATIGGSAALLEAAPESSPRSLRDGVTSKGGTTAAACAVLQQAGVSDAFVRAVAAGTARAAELSRTD